MAQCRQTSTNVGRVQPICLSTLAKFDQTFRLWDESGTPTKRGTQRVNRLAWCQILCKQEESLDLRQRPCVPVVSAMARPHFGRNSRLALLLRRSSCLRGPNRCEQDATQCTGRPLQMLWCDMRRLGVSPFAPTSSQRKWMTANSFNAARGMSAAASQNCGSTHVQQHIGPVSTTLSAAAGAARHMRTNFANLPSSRSKSIRPKVARVGRTPVDDERNLRFVAQVACLFLDRAVSGRNRQIWPSPSGPQRSTLVDIGPIPPKF